MLAGNILLLVTLSLQAAEKTKNPKLVYSLLALGVILLFAGFVFAFLKRNLGFVFSSFLLFNGLVLLSSGLIGMLSKSETGFPFSGLSRAQFFWSGLVLLISGYGLFAYLWERRYLDD